MPIIHVRLLEGRNDQKLDELSAALTRTTAQVLDSPPERIRLVITETPKSKWFVGGQSIARLEANDGS